MTSVFHDVIGRFLHVYLDDIFIYTDSIEDHERCLKLVFDRLRKNHLYLKWDKCNLYARSMDCLGHIIDNKGIHPDTDKLGRIRDWRVPRNYNDVQQFVGLVNYVANFLPSVSTYTAPLQSMTQNGAPFLWKPLHQRCFNMIKQVCCKTPVIRPISAKSEDPIWVICDASKTGIGAMYGQGLMWTTCRPAGFTSKKFTSAQQHYAVHELETLAILEALIKWEDKLLSRKIHIITDHKALEFFKTQSHLSNRQFRWIDYMSRFDFDITYVKGEHNKVADCLSRYYESDTAADVHEYHDYVQADLRIDPTGDDLPSSRYEEVVERVVETSAMRAMELRRSRQLQEAKSRLETEAQELAPPPTREEQRPPQPEPNPWPTTREHSPDRGPVAPQSMTLGDSLGNGTIGEAPGPSQPLKADEEMIKAIKNGYSTDLLFKTVLDSPEQHSKSFTIRDDLIWTINNKKSKVVCAKEPRTDH